MLSIKNTVFYFIYHPHILSTDNVVRVFVSLFQGSPQWMSWMMGEGTEGSESGGQRGGVKRGVKSAFALQFGMTLIIWSGPFWERRRLPVTTDVDYTKQGSLEGCVNKTQAHTHTYRVIVGALSPVLIDCNHHSVLANLPCSWSAGYCSLSKMAWTYDNLSTITMGLDVFFPL